MLDIQSILEHATSCETLRRVGYYVKWSTRSSNMVVVISSKVIDALEFLALQIGQVTYMSSCQGEVSCVSLYIQIQWLMSLHCELITIMYP
jgi:hypothetical protein